MNSDNNNNDWTVMLMDHSLSWIIIHNKNMHNVVIIQASVRWSSVHTDTALCHFLNKKELMEVPILASLKTRFHTVRHDVDEPFVDES